MKKGLKIAVIGSSVVVGVLILVIVFISPIAKYVIEKHSEEYTGRKITMDKLAINIFTGGITAKGLKLYEAKSKTIFFSTKQLDVNIAVYRLWSKQFEISSLTIADPYVQVIQKGNSFNYDDLMKRFSAEDTTVKKEAPAKYWVRSIQVRNAQLLYINTKPYNRIELIKGNIDLPLVAWDNPTYTINGRFALSSGGNCLAKLTLNSETYIFSLHTEIDSLNLSCLYPYLKDYMKVKSLNGSLETNMNITGNFNHPTEIAASGNIKAKGFSITDQTNELLTAIDLTDINIDTINTAKNLFNFSSIILDHPFFRLSMYDKGFNYERIMTSPLTVAGDTSSKVYSNIFLMMSAYIQDIVREYDVNNYKVNKLLLTRGQCIFTDFTHGDKFRYVLDSMRLESNRINSNNPFLLFAVNARLNTSGKMKGTLKVDPKHYKDIDIDASVRDLLITDFNPYSKYYVATPFLNGSITYVNKTTVMNGNLDSKNILDVKQIKAGKKVKNSTAMNLPVRLAVSLLKDVKGDIHLDIPVTGSLNDPKFKWGRVVWQVLKNLIIKAATAPFRLLANLFGGKEEEFKEMQFEYVQTSIQPNQRTVLDRLAKAATDKPDLKLELIQVTNITDEMEAAAVYMQKKQYLGIQAPGFNANFKQRTDSITNNDSLFVSFINGKLKTNSAIQSTEEKCVELLGREKLMPVVQDLMQQRNIAVRNYLVEQKKLSDSTVVISNTKETNQLQKSSPPKYVINIAVKE